MNGMHDFEGATSNWILSSFTRSNECSEPKKSLCIENLSKSTEILPDYREPKMVFESATNDALELLEENEDDFNAKVAQYMKNIRETSDLSFHN